MQCKLCSVKLANCPVSIVQGKCAVYNESSAYSASAIAAQGLIAGLALGLD